MSSQSFSHDSQHSEGPDDDIEVAVVDESLYKFTYVAVFGVSKFGDACGFDKIFKHFGFLTPLGGFEDPFGPFFVEFLENIKSFWEVIRINFLFLLPISWFSLLFSFGSFHNKSLVIWLPKGIDFLFDILFQLTQHWRDDILAQPFICFLDDDGSFILDGDIFFVIEKLDYFRNVWFEVFHFLDTVNGQKLNYHWKVKCHIFHDLTLEAEQNCCLYCWSALFVHQVAYLYGDFLSVHLSHTVLYCVFYLIIAPFLTLLYPQSQNLKTLVQVCWSCLLGHCLNVNLADVWMVWIFLHKLKQVLHTWKSQFSSLGLQLLQHWILFFLSWLLFAFRELWKVEIGFSNGFFIKLVVIIASDWNFVQGLWGLG